MEPLEPLRRLDETVATARLRRISARLQRISARLQRISARLRRISARCTICKQRVSAPIFVEESGDIPEPHQSWWLCADCNEAVACQFARSPTSGALRLRIAVGIVAAERHPAYRSGAVDDDQQSDKQIERLLIGTFWAVFLVHAIAFIVVTLAISHPH